MITNITKEKKYFGKKKSSFQAKSLSSSSLFQPQNSSYDEIKLQSNLANQIKNKIEKEKSRDNSVKHIKLPDYIQNEFEKYTQEEKLEDSQYAYPVRINSKNQQAIKSFQLKVKTESQFDSIMNSSSNVQNSQNENTTINESNLFDQSLIKIVNDGQVMDFSTFRKALKLKNQSQTSQFVKVLEEFQIDEIQKDRFSEQELLEQGIMEKSKNIQVEERDRYYDDYQQIPRIQEIDLFLQKNQSISPYSGLISQSENLKLFPQQYQLLGSSLSVKSEVDELLATYQKQRGSNSNILPILKETPQTEAKQAHLRLQGSLEQLPQVYQQQKSNYNSVQKELNLNHFQLNKNEAQVISELLFHQDFQEINLSQNRLGDEGVEQLLQNMTKKVKRINFSYNKITHKSCALISNMLIDHEMDIESINLEGNGFGDSGVAQLFKNPGNQIRNLQILNLSQNQLGSHSCEILARFLKKNECVEELYLHWNKIDYKGGEYLFQCLKENGNMTLKVLDLSYNNMGNEFQSRFNQTQFRFLSNTGSQNPIEFDLKKLKKQEKTAQEQKLAQFELSHEQEPIRNIIKNSCINSITEYLMYQKQVYLEHLDLSFNYFSEEETIQLSCILKKNHNLIGFHFDGNPGQVDYYGFLKPMIVNGENQQQRDKSGQQNGGAKELNYRSLVNQLMDEKSPQIIKVDQKQNRRASFVENSLEREQITYGLQVGNVSNTGQVLRINGMQCLKNSKFAELSSCWVCGGWRQEIFKWSVGISGHIAAEPISIHFDFDEYLPHQMDMESPGVYIKQVMCPPNSKIRYFFMGQGKQEFSRISPVDRNQARQKFSVNFADQTIEVDLYEVNILRTEKGEDVLDEEGQYKYECFPRTEEGTMLAPIYREPYKWTLQRSIFKDMRLEDDQFETNCFETDWANSKIPKFTKPQHLVDLQQYTRKIYPKLRRCYKALSVLGDNEVFSLNQNAFTDVVLKCRMVDNQTLRMADIDICFISSNVINEGMFYKNSLIPQRALNRFKFMEILVRLAFEKYFRNKMADNPRDSLEKLWVSGLEKFTDTFPNYNIWRTNYLYNEECDICLQEYYPIIEQIYRSYAGSKNLGKYSKVKLMRLDQFKAFCNDYNLMETHKLQQRDILSLFGQSIPSQVDEVTQDRHMFLNNYQFMQALTRLAFLTAPIPYQQELSKDKHMIWTKENCADLPLFLKIQSLLSSLYLMMNDVEFKNHFHIPSKSIFDREIHDWHTIFKERSQKKPHEVISSSNSMIFNAPHFIPKQLQSKSVVDIQGITSIDRQSSNLINISGEESRKNADSSQNYIQSFANLEDQQSSRLRTDQDQYEEISDNYNISDRDQEDSDDSDDSIRK